MQRLIRMKKKEKLKVFIYNRSHDAFDAQSSFIYNILFCSHINYRNSCKLFYIKKQKKKKNVKKKQI